MKKKNIPLLLSLSILVALLTMLLSTTIVLKNLRLDENIPCKDIVIGNQSLSLSSKVEKIPVFIDKKGSVKKYYLNVFPGVLNWTVFHCVALSLATSSILFIVLLIIRIKNKFEVNFKSIDFKLAILPMIATILAIVIFYFTISSQQITSLVSGADIMADFDIIFLNPQLLIQRFVAAFLILGCIPLVGMMIINIAIHNLHTLRLKKDYDLEGSFKTIKDSLNIFSLFSGLLLGVSIVGTRLQRDMIAEHFDKGKEIIHIIYPDSFIYSYGMGFTLILALFFLPSLLYVNYSKSVLIKKEEVTGSNNNRGFWHIGKDTLEDAKIILSIVLPLISSVVQHFI